MISVNRDDDGVCTITLETNNGAHNLLSSQVVGELTAVIERCLGDDAIRGIIITSRKDTFLTGADIGELVELRGAEEAAAYSAAVQAMLRRLETGGKPVVAALNGSALGGGYELALACHRRIAADVSDSRFGLPEVTLGLLPGGGGTQRLPRLIGVENAARYLLKGLTVPPRKALADGLVDELCPADVLLDRAKAWLRSGPDSRQPWDRPNTPTPVDPRTPAGAAHFLRLGGSLRASNWKSDAARRAILDCIYESSASPMDVALKVEQRLFASLVISREARNIVRTTFYHAREARRRCAQSHGGHTVAVLGAGMMGAGIAAVCAEAGFKVVLVDRTAGLAEAGKAYAEKAFMGRQKAGALDDGMLRDRLDRIHPTSDLSALHGCEIAIEAVFEDREVKAEIFRAVQSAAPGILLATNTSTLPITGLAQSVSASDRFIGLHFFSPVDRMTLVEVIPGAETSDETLNQALAFVRRIEKIPIVVKDSRGFFTSRVFSTYVREGLALLDEGVSPALIEHGGKLAGMPVGPLAIVDEISAKTMLQIQRQNQQDLAERYQPMVGDDVLVRLVDELDRPGKKFGRGVYDYPEGRAKELWPKLADHFPVSRPDMPFTEVIGRLLGIQALEAARCLEEGVIASPEDADLGSVLGWNYPPALGGVLSYVDGTGVAAFVQWCETLSRTAGNRFRPPAILHEMALSNRRFFEDCQ